MHENDFNFEMYNIIFDAEMHLKINAYFKQCDN